MYTRSEIRHACYRAKNNAATEKNRVILALVEPLMKHNHRWDNFSIEWDVIVTKDKKIKVIRPENNYDVIHTALLKASLYNEVGRSFDDLEEKELNIINQVEQIMLESIMTWQNYNKTWGVSVDASTNSIKTIMYNVKSNQIEVTPEMIEASKKNADGSAFVGNNDSNAVLEMKPMSDEQKKAFEEFLAKKNSQTVKE